MTNYVFMCRGNGEKLNSNMLMGNGSAMGVEDYLNADYEVIDVPWPANYGPVGGDSPLDSSYAVNLQLGIIMLKDMLQALQGDDTAVLLGYSAGASLVGNYAELAGRSPKAMYNRRILGVGLVADPMRPPGADGVPGFGVGGARHLPAADFPVFWASDPMDPITSLPANSPLRTIADQTYAMSFAPGEFPAWIGDIVDRLRTGRWQRVTVEWWNPIGVARQYAEALAAAHRYLFGGDHTSYAFRIDPQSGKNYLETLANKLNGIPRP